MFVLAARRVKTYYKKFLPGETFSLQITDSIPMVPGEKYTFLRTTHEDFGQRSRYHDRIGRGRSLPQKEGPSSRPQHNIDSNCLRFTWIF